MKDTDLAELRKAIKEHQEEAKNETQFAENAKVAKMLFDSYVGVGFNQEQALYLTATVLTAHMRGSGGKQ